LNKHTHPRIHLLYTLIIIHFELIELHLEQLIFSSRIFLLPTWISLSCIHT
jgi:hypothetical protein